MTKSAQYGLFAGSTNVSISGGSFNYIQVPDSPRRGVVLSGLELLFRGIDTNAFHNSVSQEGASGNFPRQYDEVLWKTMDWVKDPQVTERILCVHGSSYTSSIAQTVARIQQQDNIPIATYFVNKNPENQDVRARFISTIAYQLGLSFPGAREKIGNIIAHNPAILSLSVPNQLETLILQPLAPILSIPDGLVDTQHHPFLIIVNGCDYLDNYTRQCIVDALLRISQEFPLRVRILLFTKSSARITATLTSGAEDGSVMEIGFDGERSPIGAYIKNIWSKIKNVTGKIGRA